MLKHHLSLNIQDSKQAVPAGAGQLTQLFIQPHRNQPCINFAASADALLQQIKDRIAEKLFLLRCIIAGHIVLAMLIILPQRRGDQQAVFRIQQMQRSAKGTCFHTLLDPLLP